MIAGRLFVLVRNCQTVFETGCTVFAFPPASREKSYCSTLSPAFGIGSALDFGSSNVVVSHCCFKLAFPWWCTMWGIFSYTCHLCVFFGESQAFVPPPLLLSFESSLPEVSFANIFSQFVACLLLLLAQLYLWSSSSLLEFGLAAGTWAMLCAAARCNPRAKARAAIPVVSFQASVLWAMGSLFLQLNSTPHHFLNRT